jgi:undecaprenyl-diphosphatase
VNFAALGTAFLLAITFLDGPTMAYFRAADSELVIFWREVTVVGESHWMLALSALAALCGWRLSRLAKGPRLRAGARAVAGAGLYALASVAVWGLAAALVKLMIGRARPKMAPEFGPYHFEPFAFDFKLNSLPSGHATTLFALAGAAALIWPRLRPAIVALTAWAAFSRAPAGAHYLSDVIAGSALGWFGARFLARRLAARGVLFTPDLALKNRRAAARAVRLMLSAPRRRVLRPWS